MASHVTKTFFLAVCLTCFIHLVTGYTLVPGIPVPPNTPVPPRLEINKFLQNTTYRNIFLLALSEMQELPINLTTSFYQIGAIHGTAIPWDGDDGGIFGFDYGYCRHADPLFPTWHRPYLSLYEKTLFDLATEIVNGFPNGTKKNQHLGALKSWRHPYWDWAKNGSLPRVVLFQKKVVVTKVVNGTLRNVSIRNPLYSFPTNPNDPYTTAAGDPISGPYTVETVRNPAVRNSTFVTRANFTNNRMIDARPFLKDEVYQAFMGSPNYTAFSNVVDGNSSIEAPHGSVHILLGGTNGHMAFVDYAGFDPIFYLHHANVDRFLALWQAIYPDRYVSNNTNDTYNEDTPLHPFRKTDTQYWTSKLARNVTAFGYTYPELTNCDPECAIAVLNDLYGPGSSRRKRAMATSGARYNEYAVVIKIANVAANGPFSVHIFLGEPTANITEFTTDPNYVGSFDVFTPINTGKLHRKIVRKAVSLTSALSRLNSMGKLRDMTANTVADYTKKSLRWIITTYRSTNYVLDDSTVDVDVDEVESLVDVNVLDAVNVDGVIEKIEPTTTVSNWARLPVATLPPKVQPTTTRNNLVTLAIKTVPTRAQLTTTRNNLATSTASTVTRKVNPPTDSFDLSGFSIDVVTSVVEPAKDRFSLPVMGSVSEIYQAIEVADTMSA